MRVCENGEYRDATPEEIAEWESAASQPTPPPTPEEQTVTLARAMAATATTLTDAVALSVPDLLPTWNPNIGSVEKGQVYRYQDKTYRCVQAHTTQEGWEPDKTPAMWVIIELTATGAIDDPITAARGMEYEYGKYYKDPDDSKIYLCKRVGEYDGGKIVLQYLPHELVGDYFQSV